jgi:hypothetical protein
LLFRAAQGAFHANHDHHNWGQLAGHHIKKLYDLLGLRCNKSA